MRSVSVMALPPPLDPRPPQLCRAEDQCGDDERHPHDVPAGLVPGRRMVHAPVRHGDDGGIMGATLASNAALITGFVILAWVHTFAGVRHGVSSLMLLERGNRSRLSERFSVIG